MQTQTLVPKSLYHTVLETPFGKLYVAYAEKYLCLLSGDELTLLLDIYRLYGRFPARNDAMSARMIADILTSVLGDRAYRGPLLFPSHTPFQRQVLKKLQEIPRGEVRSYGWLAKRLEHPRASRAVGNALAWNPFPFVIPCHRVIRADGRLGKYSGGGDNMKARLLAYEGVSIGQGKDGTWRVQEGQGG
ncbi:MAG: methylated-DNA--[protein]-cysteine S-methyltransferase [Acidithiobacillus sp.]